MAKLSGSIKAWASNPVHLVGDYPGDDTKVDGGDGVIHAGFIPGDVFAPTAEETNFEMNRWTSVLQWVQDGGSTGSATAQIMEKDSNGVSRAQRYISVNTAGIDLSGADFTGNGVGEGVIGRSTRTGVKGIADASGANPAVWGVHGGAGDGVRGDSSTGRGGYFLGGGTGVGVRGDGGAGGAAGATFNGTGGEPDIFLAPSGNYGIDIQNGGTALGGIRILANGQLGLLIQQDNANFEAALFYGDGAAVAGLATVEARAFGTGDALHGYTASGNGYAARFTPKAAAAVRGAAFFAGQSARPSNTESGQITYLGTEGHFAVSSFEDFGEPGPGVGWRGLWSSTGGYALGHVTLRSATTNGAVQVEVGSMTSNAGDSPKFAGRTIRLRLMINARMTAAVDSGTLNVKVRDETASLDIFTRTGAGAGATAGYFVAGASARVADTGVAQNAWPAACIAVTFTVTIPLSGTRNWKFYISTPGVSNIAVRDASLEYLGLA